MSWLPPYEKMRQIVMEKLKKTPEELDADLAEYQKVYSDFPEIALNKRVLLAIYASDKGVQIPVEVPFKKAVGKDVKLADVDENMSNFNVTAYVVKVSELLTFKGTHAVAFWLLDDTAFAEGRVYGESANDMWDKLKIKCGDLIRIENANTFTTPDGVLYLTIGNFSTIKKLDSPPWGQSLNELCSVPISALKDGTFACITGVLLDINEDIAYIGCPLCKSKLEAKEGESVKCERCGNNVKAKSYKVIRFAVSDGNGDVVCRLSPEGSNDSEKLKSALWEPIRVYGLYMQGRMEVGFFELLEPKKKAKSAIAEKFIQQPTAPQTPPSPPSSQLPPVEIVELSQEEEEKVISYIVSTLKRIGEADTGTLIAFCTSKSKRDVTFPKLTDKMAVKIIEKAEKSGKIKKNDKGEYVLSET